MTPRERGAVRSEGMGRFATSQTLLRAEPVMQPSRSEYRAPARPHEIRRLGCWSVRSGWVATSSRTEVVAGGREDDVGRITVAVFEAASAEVAVTLKHVADHGLDGGSPPGARV